MFGRLSSFLAAFALALGALVAPSFAHAASSTLTLNAPCASSALMADSVSTISWTHSDGYAPFVNLSYSLDGGATWESIIRNTPNDGSYAWTVAHVQNSAVLVKIEETDLADVFTTAISAPFSVQIYHEDNSPYWESDEVPLPEVLDAIDGIAPGDLVRLEGSDAVSYVDDGMIRRPFTDAAAAFTYVDTATQVLDISENTYHKMDIGSVMLPKAGVVLVKTPSISRVYLAQAQDDGTVELRWITFEAIAEEMFGASWNEYVLDVDATAFVHYRMGDAIEEAYSVDTSLLKRVADLH